MIIGMIPQASAVEQFSLRRIVTSDCSFYIMRTNHKPRFRHSPKGERSKSMDGKNRKDIKPGLRVSITQKQDQRTGKLTGGIVKDILTKSAFHSRGIKVRLQTGEVGRVQAIIETGQEVTGRG